MDMTENSNSREAYLRNYMRANTAVNSLSVLVLSRLLASTNFKSKKFKKGPVHRGAMTAPLHPRGVFSREKAGSAHVCAQFSIELTDAAAKGRLFPLRKPWVASSAEIARSNMRPPFGLCRSAPAGKGR